MWMPERAPLGGAVRPWSFRPFPPLGHYRLAGGRVEDALRAPLRGRLAGRCGAGGGGL